MIDGLRGICAAVITPLDGDLRPDPSVAIPYYQSLLASGCNSLNILGTTGEAASLSADERIAFMEALAAGGLPRERCMIGTGAAALRDCIRLTSAAFRLGFAGALVMPPFFFRGISDDGVLHFFELLMEAVHPPRAGILLYHYPKMSGVAFHPDLVDKLMQCYPGLIGGFKDSANEPELERELHARHPEMLMFPSKESSLTPARERGYAGCISGTVALWPELAARVWAGEASAQDELTRLRDLFGHISIINGVRYTLARRTGNNDWERCLPPLTPLPEEAASELARLNSATLRS